MIPVLMTIRNAPHDSAYAEKHAIQEESSCALYPLLCIFIRDYVAVKSERISN